MNPAMAGAPYRVPPEPSRMSAIALAVVVHAGLLLFLWAGIQWQSTIPAAVEAEIWDIKTQSAAPPPVAAVEPEPEPTPKVEEKPVEAPVAPKPPDIALEKAKILADKKKLLEEKKLAEKKAAKDKADKLAKDAAEKKLAEEKAAKSKKGIAEKKAADKLREDEIRRITGGAGTSGEALKSTAPRIDTGYMASLISKIKGNIAYSGSTEVPGAPKAVYRIEQLPTGEIINVKKMKSSGIPAYDSAVENAIAKSSPLPKKKDGSVERSIEATFDLKDLP